MSLGAQVVARGLFLMVVSSQEMLRVAGDVYPDIAGNRRIMVEAAAPAGSATNLKSTD